MDRLQWMSQMKKDPVHKKIMETRKRFVEDESFDPDEAMEAAIEKRKFLLQRMLEDRQHFHDSDDDNDTGVHCLHCLFTSVLLFDHVQKLDSMLKHCEIVLNVNPCLCWFVHASRDYNYPTVPSVGPIRALRNLGSLMRAAF